jgi:hypothetical protein
MLAEGMHADKQVGAGRVRNTILSIHMPISLSYLRVVVL